MNQELAQIVALLVRNIPDSLLEPLYRGLASGAFYRREEWANLSSSPSTRIEIVRCFDSWQKAIASHHDLNAQSLSFAIQVAMQSEVLRTRYPEAELVWSGPQIDRSDWRQTEAALLQIINSAQRSLWIVTFAAYRVDSLVQALQYATARGVALNFVVETSADSEGKLSFDAAEAFRQLSVNSRVYYWPREKRHMDGTKFGVLHAKCSVADGQIGLVSSANLTDNAFHLNIEIGVLLHGTPAKRLENHLQSLVSLDIIRTQEL